MAERIKDSIDWRSNRAKEIVEVINRLGFDIAIVSDKVYKLKGFEIVRLVNIFKTSRRMKRSLNGLEGLIRRRERIYEEQAETTEGIRKIKRKINQ
jgi:hypothetical protein